MRKTAFATVEKAWTSNDAGRMIALLRNAGLHPMDLAAAAPLRLPGTEPEFPIQVPIEESEAARGMLETYHACP